MCGDAREHLLGRLDDRTPLAHQVAGAEHRHGIVGERRQHVRTVRSAAYARNRPRRRLAWLLALILLLLIALAARVDASPADDTRSATSDGFAEAIRFANILTGEDPDALTAANGIDEDRDDDDDDDDDDRDDCDGDDCDHCDDDDCDDSGREDDDDDDRTPRELAIDDDRDPEGATVEDISSDLAGGALAGHIAGELAMLETGVADSGAVAGEDVSFAATSAGGAETYESWMRHQRPSPWGRLDVGVAWRQRWSEPMSGMTRRYDEVWLVATWRR